MNISPDISTSLFAAVSATAAAIGTALDPTQLYMLASSTNCFVKQGTCRLVTCVTKANFADTDFMTVTIDGVAVIYEFDKAGDGVTAGRVQVNISADTTAAECAARLRTALLANQTSLQVTDNADGTLTVVAPSRTMVIAESVANAGFLNAIAILPPTAASGSIYVPLNYTLIIDGARGPQCGILRSTADGSASITHMMRL